MSYSDYSVGLYNSNTCEAVCIIVIEKETAADAKELAKKLLNKEWEITTVLTLNPSPV